MEVVDVLDGLEDDVEPGDVLLALDGGKDGLEPLELCLRVQLGRSAVEGIDHPAPDAVKMLAVVVGMRRLHPDHHGCTTVKVGRVYVGLFPSLLS